MMLERNINQHEPLKLMCVFAQEAAEGSCVDTKYKVFSVFCWFMTLKRKALNLHRVCSYSRGGFSSR